jgi:hypothetical protein
MNESNKLRLEKKQLTYNMMVIITNSKSDLQINLTLIKLGPILQFIISLEIEGEALSFEIESTQTNTVFNWVFEGQAVPRLIAMS